MDRHPKCNPETPKLNETVDILQKLLDIELERLDVAVQIEKERNIVFPETTVIIRDIQKLSQAIKNKNTTPDLLEYEIQNL